MHTRITGVMVQYYNVCKRELWLFAHHLHWEESDYLDIGRLIHEKSYSRKKKDILIDDTISVDFLKKKRNIVLEIKKSSSLVDPVRYQTLYYLWYLKQKGINCEGEIVYPEEKKKEKVILNRKLEKDILKIIKKIRNLVKLQKPPKPRRKPYCTKCSYHELCWC